ncbi:YezD family protein [Ethanoligenens harbinense]|uniref:DUF2292 domain-containing protein n=1 Tax=Ethanoligenens harbinense (strain DSM 18485 / JCM 12961 / CGMCC 1.5033 / YUAN-3) TaxID=663278 RepID=E6U986_ETHHY|nr:YezD family protein [Ethanoligenens harbinense]ADU27245.1 Protein of unknown function DUF2292 [Ethanoligenens harbinense YUAN-3]AVQ96311.1 DUF2292 domain-containing protein [Ethanoligenens harbinense YUAN-3]AYF38970.1 DUF2292 domain-containing protein [Ethanoligenens harbinense]AYF41722.1 DUF2292 domain-containing protein [Ethanoligenens harbinense]QCN92552.1 DUF2292 domain-containing protein [Ethanoligenens harbinense]
MSDISSREREEIAEQLLQYIQSVQYGSVTVIIQDGKVIQIEKNEKVRLR